MSGPGCNSARPRARGRPGRDGDSGVSALLRVRDLSVEFHTQAGVLRAVDGLSFRLRAGSAVALVGESGSGKSVTAQAILGLLPRTAKITRGQVLLADADARGGAIDLARLDPGKRAFRAVRGDRISIIFQEPMTSLSPLHTVGDQIREALLLHTAGEPAPRASGGHRRDAARVGFPDPGQAFAHLPVRALGRPAPARDDRHGAGLRPGAADRRRADAPRSTSRSRRRSCS